MQLIRQGQRIPVANITRETTLTLDIAIASHLSIDTACFGLDGAGRLSDDRYMVFFNQQRAPGDCVIQQTPNAYRIELAAIPSVIDKLVFTVAIDGPGTMSQIGASQLTLSDTRGQAIARCDFDAGAFAQERAIMLIEFYRRNGEWRLSPVLQGFNEGLDAIVRHFGGEVAAPPPAPALTLSLEKKVAAAAPALVSLAKKAQISLEKNNLSNVRARVGLALDASGSMNGQYSRGRVQEVVNRLLPLAVHFDDDGEIDTWAFGARAASLGTVNLRNYPQFISAAHGGWRNWPLGSRVNCEVAAIEMIVNHYQHSGDRTPCYILFISDGGVHDNRKITRAITEAARLPIFWQFVGLGGSDYGILEKLDEMPGRVVDNANFFALDDLHDVTEEALYDLLMGEFPDWLMAARRAGIID